MLPMVAFWGTISDEHLSNVFRFEDQDFLNRVKIVLGDEYMRGEFKYHMNIDIASMFIAWAFELLGVDCAHWLVLNSVMEEWRGDLDYISAWENVEIQLELEKWSPSLGRRLGGDSSSSSSLKKKLGRPRGSKNIMGGRSLWIGFPPKAHDDHVDEEDQNKHAMEGCEKGKEIVVVNVADDTSLTTIETLGSFG
ncbi:hypothetical protein SUGI_1136020 [Cryptomeria japonica]|nr:hypothetical protein SUGI_1136020 [Cryptomeria japonica]